MADEARGFGGQRGDEREGERERRGSLPAGCLSRFRSIWAWSGVDRLLLGVNGGGRGPHVPRGAGGGPRHHRRRPLHPYDHHGPQPRTSSSSLILVPKAVRSDLDSPPHHPKRTFPENSSAAWSQGKKHTSSASVCRTHTGVEVARDCARDERIGELRAGRPCDRWHDGMLFRSLLLCQELEGE